MTFVALPEEANFMKMNDISFILYDSNNWNHAKAYAIIRVPLLRSIQPTCSAQFVFLRKFFFQFSFALLTISNKK